MRRLTFLTIVFLVYSVLPVMATRLPSGLANCLQGQFKGARFRIDGSFTTIDGQLYLPLLPPVSGLFKRKPTLTGIFPSQEDPKVVLFNNGWSFVCVQKHGSQKTISIPANLPKKSLRQIMTARFPEDLVVPEYFVLPFTLSQMAGELNIKILPEKELSQQISMSRTQTLHPKQLLWFLTSLNTGVISMLEGGNLTKLADFPTEGTPGSMAVVEEKLYLADETKHRVLILDYPHQQFLKQIDLPEASAPKGICALNNGKLIYVSESGTNDIAVIETATGQVLLRTRVQSGPGRLDLTPDNNYLLVLNVQSNLLTIISTQNQRVVAVLKVGAMPSSIVVSKDSSTAYVSNRMSNTITIVDLKRKQLLGTIAVGSGPTGMALNQDDTILIVANARDNTIAAYDTRTREKIKDLKLPMDIDFPGDLCFFPDGKHLLISSEGTDTIGVLNMDKFEIEKESTVGHTSHNILWVPAS